MENYLEICIASVLGSLLGIWIAFIIDDYRKEILSGIQNFFKCFFKFFKFFFKVLDYVFLNNFFKKKREAEERAKQEKKEKEHREYKARIRKGISEGKSFIGFDKLMATLIKMEDELERKKEKDK